MTELAETSIVLTRPIGQLEPLRSRLKDRGRHCIDFPALAIGPARDPKALAAALAELEQMALVVFVSPNAIEYALKELKVPWPSSVAIAVMGPGSRARLADFGVDISTTIMSPAHKDGQRFDSEALFEEFDLAALAGRRCLVIRGNGGRNWLIDTLRSHGVDVSSVEAYQRSIGEPDTEAIEAVRTLIDKQQAASIVVTSSEALSTLKDIVTSHYGEAGLSWLLSQDLLVTHLRIAENATAAGFVAVRQCDPGDEALVRALE